MKRVIRNVILKGSRDVMTEEKKRIVINGATGTIGMAVAHRWLTKGAEIVALVRSDSKRRQRLNELPNVKVIECSLCELSDFSLSDSIKQIGTCDVFYHLAWDGAYGDARNDLYLQNRNIEYTLDAVQAAYALGCKTFIGAGSQAEYGRTEGKLNAKTLINPENGYGSAKFCAGQMSRIMCHELGMKHIWTRILSVYGPYDADYTMIMQTIQKLLDGQIPELTKGEQLWDYIYCDDAAEALALLEQKGINEKTYCIGSGTAVPLKDYIQILRDAIDPGLKLDFGKVPYSPLQVMHLCADIDELNRDTGFVPQVGFEEGIRKTINWIRNGKR